jgi:hypothetical protein
MVPAQDWRALDFLLGQWTGAGSGTPGSSTGSFSFNRDLQGKVLIRRSFAEYPAAEGKPASRHNDLTIVYRDEVSGRLRATYYDNEGHVIAYSVTPADGRVVFESEPSEKEPRYRLTYARTGPSRLQLKFEIAPPRKPYSTYIDAEMQKSAAK